VGEGDAYADAVPQPPAPRTVAVGEEVVGGDRVSEFEVVWDRETT